MPYAKTKSFRKAIIIDNQNIHNYTIKISIESINLMSKKFDSFGKQLQELTITIKNIEDKNKTLKEENYKL